jgi:hypothetical protein
MSVYGSTKSSALSIVKEVTAGTLVDPAGVTDYVTLQPDITLTPNFNLLTNAEIRASIGPAKSIQGLESPQGSFSHYLKHSGTEGTAPEMKNLLEAAFGSTSTNGTQRLTTSSSTASLIKLASGGSDFARGKAILIKDGTNGYSIRPVMSVSTNDLTLGFNVATAPATGIGVGKCINFTPANSGHPSLAIHDYRGNGQVYQAMAGARVSKFSFQAKAGDFINANFAFGGTKFYFNPIRITSSTKYLDFLAGSTDYNVSVAVQVYRDPHELAQAIQDAMNAAGAADVFTVAYQDNDAANSGTHAGMFKLSSNGTTFSIKFNSGSNTANSIASKIGFSTASDKTGALFYYSTSVLSWASPYTPSLDSADPLAAKNNEIMFGDAADYACFCAQEVQFSLDNTLTDVGCICAESGIDQKLITARKVSVQVTALLDKHDAQRFKRYRSNSSVQFAFNFGVKSGGNWVAGQCGNLFMPTATISKFELTDLDSLVGLQMTLDAYVDSSGNGEVYLNFL